MLQDDQYKELASKGLDPVTHLDTYIYGEKTAGGHFGTFFEDYCCDDVWDTVGEIRMVGLVENDKAAHRAIA